jgi:hypothetical protein
MRHSSFTGSGTASTERWHGSKDRASSIRLLSRPPDGRLLHDRDRSRARLLTVHAPRGRPRDRDRLPRPLDQRLSRDPRVREVPLRVRDSGSHGGQAHPHGTQPGRAPGRPIPFHEGDRAHRVRRAGDRRGLSMAGLLARRVVRNLRDLARAGRPAMEPPVRGANRVPLPSPVPYLF